MGDDCQARGADHDVAGFCLGGDVLSVDQDVQIGLFAAVTDARTETDGLADHGDTRVYQAGVYGAKQLEPRLRVSGTASAAWLVFSTFRPTISGAAKGKTDGIAAFAAGEIAYDLPMDDTRTLILSPYAGLDARLVHYGGYRERGVGAGVLDLTVDAETTTQLFLELGVQATRALRFGAIKLDASGRLGWAHQYLDRRTELKAAFTSKGPAVKRDSAKLGLYLAIAEDNSNVSHYTRYQGAIAADANNHIFTAGAKFTW